MKYVIFIVLFFLCCRLWFFYFLPPAFTNGQHVAFSALLLEDPKLVGNKQEFSVRLGNFWSSVNVAVTTDNAETYMYGETVTMVGTLLEKSLKNKQAYFAIQNPQIEAKTSGFLPAFGILRGKIIDFCEKNFSQPYSGLLIGIIFGIKSLLTNSTTASFRITGLAHVVAASGMNVTLVAGFLFGILGSFLARKWAILFSIGGIFLYVCLSGFDASIVRAALMGATAFSAYLFGRQYSGVYVLFLVGAGMLLWDPMLLIDVGFQLSILATVGILVLKPSLFGSFISDDLGTTLAAQIATLPVLLITFGQYSLLSVIANVLILWTIPLIMTVGMVGVFVGLFLPLFGKTIVLSIIPLLWYMVQVTKFFAAHALSVQLTTVPIIFIIGYYFLLTACVLFMSQSKNKNTIDKG